MNVVTIVVYGEGDNAQLYYQHSCPLETVKAILQETLEYVEKDIAEKKAQEMAA